MVFHSGLLRAYVGHIDFSNHFGSLTTQQHTNIVVFDETTQVYKMTKIPVGSQMFSSKK